MNLAFKGDGNYSCPSLFVLHVVNSLKKKRSSFENRLLKYVRQLDYARFEMHARAAHQLVDKNGRNSP